MKATTLILIFSGLVGLNRCSDEIKVDLGKFSTDKNLKIEAIKDKKSENTKDTLPTSSFFIELLGQSCRNVLGKKIIGRGCFWQ